MGTCLRHIALFVPDLRAAEAYYQRLFEMAIIGREAEMEEDEWYALPPDKGWEDAEAAGIELSMVALRRDDFVLALFPGDPQPGQVYLIGLSMSQPEIADVRQRMPKDAILLEDQPTVLSFRDRYSFDWQIYKTDTEFRNSGEWGGRWLEV